MRRRIALASAALAISALALSGCGSDSPAAKETTPNPSASTTAPVVAGAPGACSAPAHTMAPAANIAEIENAAALPAATGSFGERPEITFPADATPSAETQVTVLAKGEGETVTEGSFLVANYLGRIWGGEVFDNSYDRGAASGFPIGTGTVIPGWDKGLVGQSVGSRVMLVIPPEDGYGTAGQTDAGITGTDTLVFVVDIVEFCAPYALAEAKATMGDKLPADGPQVSGELGSSPTVAIGDATEPKEVVTTVVATGEGEPVVAGSLILQYVAQAWSGESAGSSWVEGQSAMVAPVIPGQPTAVPMFNDLVGIPIGSRVLIQVPAVGETPAMAVVIDIASQATVLAP